MENKDILRVENLKIYFNAKKRSKKTVKAVDGLTFSIKEGEVFGLVGESGCGKSTTGRAIIGLYKAHDGHVYFKDQEITGKMDNKKRRFISDNMMMIFQDPISSLNPRMTVQEIISEGLKVRGIKDQKILDEKVLSILNKVGLLPEHASRYPHEFSGGQRQRIGIARALIVNPTFIIADEPISALDVSIQAQVINLLDALKDELDLTILFIAHDLSVVKYFSDRIGVMYFGKLVEIADAEKLYKNPVHPYTRALLSAIPQPDPRKEKTREIHFYDPSMHDYEDEEPVLHEISEGHYVLANSKEIALYQERYKD